MHLGDRHPTPCSPTSLDGLPYTATIRQDLSCKMAGPAPASAGAERDARQSPLIVTFRDKWRCSFGAMWRARLPAEGAVHRRAGTPGQIADRVIAGIVHAAQLPLL